MIRARFETLSAKHLRSLLGRVGERSIVSADTSFRDPKSIVIGSRVEVRRGCGFYARKKPTVAISIGDRCRIKEYCILDSYGGSICLGDQVLLGQGCTIHGHGGVEIGDYVLIGAHTCIFSNDHSFDRVPQLIQSHPEKKHKTIVGTNVWIGASCVVLAGVSIGSHSVIGAGAVVSRSIPDYSLALGVPAKVVRILCAPADKKL